jgi:hypothetical protein
MRRYALLLALLVGCSHSNAGPGSAASPPAALPSAPATAPRASGSSRSQRVPEWDSLCNGDEGWYLQGFTPDPYANDPALKQLGCSAFATMDGPPTIAGFCCKRGAKLP